MHTALASHSKAPRVLVPSSSQVIDEQSMEPEKVDKDEETRRPRTRREMAMEFPVESTAPSIPDPPRQQLPAAPRREDKPVAQRKSRKADNPSSPSPSFQGKSK